MNSAFDQRVWRLKQGVDVTYAGKDDEGAQRYLFDRSLGRATVHIGSLLPVVISVGTAMVLSRDVRSGRLRMNDLIAVSMPRRFAQQKALTTMAAAAGSLFRVRSPDENVCQHVGENVP